MLFGASALSLNAQEHGSHSPAAPATQPPPPPRVMPEANDPSGWKRYQYRYGSGETLAALFPSPPKEEVFKEPLTNGKEVITHVLMTNTEAGVYLACYIEVPSDIKITPEAKKKILDDLWRNFAKGMQEGLQKRGIEAELTASEPRQIMVGGRQAQEQDFMIGKLPGHYRALVGSNHLYMVAIISLKDESASRSDAFIESFSVLP